MWYVVLLFSVLINYSFIRAYAMLFVLLLPSTFLFISIFSFSIGWWCLNVTFLLCVCAYRLWFDFFDYSLLISIPWQPCIRRHLYRPLSVWLWQFDQHDLSFLLCHCVLVGWLVGWLVEHATKGIRYGAIFFIIDPWCDSLNECVCVCVISYANHLRTACSCYASFVYSAVIFCLFV